MHFTVGHDEQEMCQLMQDGPAREQEKADCGSSKSHTTDQVTHSASETAWFATHSVPVWCPGRTDRGYAAGGASNVVETGLPVVHDFDCSRIRLRVPPGAILRSWPSPKRADFGRPVTLETANRFAVAKTTSLRRAPRGILVYRTRGGSMSDGTGHDGIDTAKVDSAVAYTNARELSGTLEVWRAIGLHLVETFFAGDVDAANERNASSDPSYRAFLADERLTVDRRDLGRAKTLVKQLHDLRDDIRPHDLSYKHHLHLMRLPTVARRRLLAIEAVRSGWTAARLGEVVDEEVPQKVSVHPEVRHVRSVGAAMDTCTLDRLAALPDGLFEVEIESAELAARALLSRLKQAKAARTARQAGQR
jgi:hypothetical protein